jgi:uncharacterized protein
MTTPEMPTETAAEVVDVPERSRYELTIAGEVAGFLDYVDEDGVLVLPHAEIDPARRGHGLGAELVRQVLDRALVRGTPIEPRCPFVADFIASHPEYAGLVAR